MSGFANISGTFKNIKDTFVKVSDSYKTCINIHIKINSVWKPIWSYSWNIRTWGDCSVDC